MKNKKVKIISNWYGIINEICDDNIIANLYSTKTHELVYVIEFPITNFPVHERNDVCNDKRNIYMASRLLR